MQFSSAIFLILFLPALTIFYFAAGSGHRKYKNTILLLGSILFYAWGEPIFIFVMLGSICLNYFIALKITTSNARKKYLLYISLVFNLGILIIFKYLTFILRNLSLLIDLPMIEIALPIGISFYTFQIMSYIFDVYYGTVPVQRNICSLALYITMFPQLVAGPIVRYSTIAYEIQQRNETFSDFESGINRFIIGLSKKVLLADFLAGIADKIFNNAQFGPVPMLTAWIGALAYTFEIYYDFSGYSDMAIGLGRCFGFHFLENFDYPYIAKSISEFWQRWHISLTSFFRDYVYIPMGGNRVSPKRHIFNLFTIWLLTGIWHGAAWNFIIWGLLYFAIQLLEKYTGFAKRLPALVGHIYTLFIVILLWVIFRAKTMTDAATYFSYMFTLSGGLADSQTMQFIKSSIVIFTVSCIGSFPTIPALKKRFTNSNRSQIFCEIVSSAICIGLLLLCLLLIINGSYSPFIYFNF